VGVTPPQTSWLAAYYTRRIQPVGELGIEDGISSYYFYENRDAFVFEAFTEAAVTPTLPSPIEGEGKKGELGAEITRYRVNVGLKTLIPGVLRADL
jgi:hypothetical protein